MYAQGIFADPNKVKATREWPKPKMIIEVQSLHGLASFHRRFIRHFNSIMVMAATNCLKKEPFQWTPKVVLCF